ncbi:hypothetical protein BKA70DRAFT_1402151 [Coprinopsis sp. MPI-PUGE-AT-0042]|nr:hypothetical protein BKA70DRAFT_1402151 [Coprinopsis sp. MPI-PUGE-AT-0042]
MVWDSILTAHSFFLGIIFLSLSFLILYFLEKPPLLKWQYPSWASAHFIMPPTLPTSLPPPNPPTQPEPEPTPTSSSWSTTLHTALLTSCSSPLSCLPCLRTIPSDDSLHNHASVPPRQGATPVGGQGGLYANTINNIPRARPDELEGLLTSSFSTSTSSSFGWSDNEDNNEDDRFSLHTNPGLNPHRKRSAKKKKAGKITLFGYDLFGMGNRGSNEQGAKGKGKGRGRGRGRIQLDEETDDALYRDTSTSALAPPPQDDNEEPYTDEPTPQSKGKSKAKSRKFDRDAAPLSSARIAELAAEAEAESASASSSPRASLNPISPPDSPSSTFPIAPSRDSEDGDFHFEDDSFNGPLSPTTSSEPPPKKPSSSKKKSSSKKSTKGTAADMNLIKTQLAHLERLKANGTLPESNGGLEFEGFQGSGSFAPPRGLREGVVARRSVGTLSTSSSGSSSRSGSGSGSRSGSGSGSGRTGSRSGMTRGTTPSSASPLSPPPLHAKHEQQYAASAFGDTQDIPSVFADAQREEEEEDADLDGAMYAGPRRRGYVPGGGSQGRMSDSRSQGSQSQGRRSGDGQSQGRQSMGGQSQGRSHTRSDSRSSSGAQYAQYPVTSPLHSGVASPLGFGPLGSPFAPREDEEGKPLGDVPKKTKKKVSSKSKTVSSSGTRSNRSNSVVGSPTSPTFQQQGGDEFSSNAAWGSPSGGFSSPGLKGFTSSSGFPSPGLGGFPSPGLGKTFPSTGFGRSSTGSAQHKATMAVGAAPGLKASDMAKMLKREEGDEFEGF